MARQGEKLSEFKEKAKETWKGLETCTIASFTPDLSALDEEGIRWDVQQCIKHGFFSTLACSVGLSFEETIQLIDIITDEAKGRILVSVIADGTAVEKTKAILKHAEKAGCSHAMLGYPPNFFPKTEEDIYTFTKNICESSKLSFYIYSTQKYSFEKFHPSGVPPTVLSRIADIDNVVGLKIGSGDFGYIAECFERCGDRLLVNCPAVGMLPVMVKAYRQQWAGAAVFETYQTPEKPYLVEAFNLMMQGKTDSGMELFDKIKPLIMMFEMQMMPMIMLGSYHWALLKYYQWLTGGNGGIVRAPLRMHQHQLDMAKMAMFVAGQIPRQAPFEEFLLGRCYYARTKKP